MAWIKVFHHKRIDDFTGKEMDVYYCTCPICGWETGHQGTYFNYCPICGTYHKEKGDAKVRPRNSTNEYS